MIDIGIVGVDTSHPERFGSLLDARTETTVSAVWDGGDVREPAHVQEFCRAHDAERYEDPHEMIGEIDAVLVLTVDWNTHRSLAVPFLEAGVPTAIDKPIAGTVADIEAIETAAIEGDAPLFGGSALPFHPEVSTLERTQQTVAFAIGYGSPFYYGVHLVDSLCRIFDSDWERIDTVDATGTTIGVSFEDGSRGTFTVDVPAGNGTFGFLTVGDRMESALVEGTPEELTRMYEPYIDAFVETIRGERNDRDRLLDGASLLLAVDAVTADTSQHAEDDGPLTDVDSPLTDTVSSLTADSPALNEIHVDSSEFVADYEPYY